MLLTLPVTGFAPMEGIIARTPLCSKQDNLTGLPAHVVSHPGHARSRALPTQFNVSQRKFQ
jgi:hypothetical protein